MSHAESHTHAGALAVDEGEREDVVHIFTNTILLHISDILCLPADPGSPEAALGIGYGRARHALILDGRDVGFPEQRDSGLDQRALR